MTLTVTARSNGVEPVAYIGPQGQSRKVLALDLPRTNEGTRCAARIEDNPNCPDALSAVNIEERGLKTDRLRV
jgi:hypothetical protein